MSGSETPQQNNPAKQSSVWDALRKPFPKEVIGKLPKGNVQLDFVGHAAVTDRLNNVCGPENWNWEPLALDDRGLPALDSKGFLWIKLMVRADASSQWVIRLGYGDGSQSMKELIGDALRNAAMRFGIALDLWSKEELESTLEKPENKNQRATAKTSVSKPTPAAASEPEPAKPTTSDLPASPAQVSQVKALFYGMGHTEEEMVDLLWTTYGVDEAAGKPMTKAKYVEIVKDLKR